MEGRNSWAKKQKQNKTKTTITTTTTTTNNNNKQNQINKIKKTRLVCIATPLSPSVHPHETSEKEGLPGGWHLAALESLDCTGAFWMREWRVQLQCNHSSIVSWPLTASFSLLSHYNLSLMSSVGVARTSTMLGHSTTLIYRSAVYVTYMANSRVYGECTRLVILWIYIAILHHSISRPFSTWFPINNVPIIRMRTCTGGAPPLVARACAPVCPSVATPLMSSLAMCSYLRMWIVLLFQSLKYKHLFTYKLTASM